MNNEILFKPNDLILATSSQSVTSSEYKLYDTLLQRCQITKDSNWRKAEISREDIKNIIKSSDNSTIDKIKETLNKFMSVQIKFKLGNKHVGATLLAEYIYDENTDLFTCSMSENVFIALMSYNEIGYSPINLRMVRQAKGFYTQKIYGLLRRWSGQYKIKEISIEELKSICDIKDGSSYDLYKALKNKVLVPAVNEINEKLNMKVEFKEIKTCRKVTSIEFHITDYEPRKYNFEKSKIVEPKKVSVDDELVITNDDIDSLEYMNLIDLNINESIHTVFLQDFSDYKNYMVAVETASDKTLAALGSKTINKRNYKYFKTTLKNLLPSEEIIL